jgi:hypothetical protein
MRSTLAIPIVTALLIASLLTGCGGGTDTSATTTTATAASGNSAVCASITKVKSAANAFKRLDPSTVSAAQLQKTFSNLSTGVTDLSSALSKAGPQAKAEVKTGVDSFKSQLKSAQNQSLEQQLITLGTAIGQLQTSLSQATSQFKCNQ